jgi:death-on-curing family protein
MNVVSLKITDVKHIAFRLAKLVMDWDEPIPDFSTRYPGVLESCIRNPFQTYNGEDLYPNLIDKAGNLFYLLIKNHPFENGNKRIAICTLLVFLKLNHLWIEVNPEVLYEFARFVAESSPKLKNEVEAAIREFISENMSITEN